MTELLKTALMFIGGVTLFVGLGILCVNLHELFERVDRLEEHVSNLMGRMREAEENTALYEAHLKRSMTTVWKAINKQGKKERRDNGKAD